jgi:hypothetical protein
MAPGASRRAPVVEEGAGRSSLLAFFWSSSGTSGTGPLAFVRAYDTEQMRTPTAPSVLRQLAERARADGVLDRCSPAPAVRGAMIDLDHDVTPAWDPAAEAQPRRLGEQAR